MVIKLLYGVRQSDYHRKHQTRHKEPLDGGIGRVPDLLGSPIEKPVEHIAGHAGIADNADYPTAKRLKGILMLRSTVEKQFADGITDEKNGKNAYCPQHHLCSGTV